jgi:hypothetical protein
VHPCLRLCLGRLKTHLTHAVGASFTPTDSGRTKSAQSFKDHQRMTWKRALCARCAHA